MDSLNKIPDGELLTMVRTKVETERKLTLEVIELLQEVYSRRLHLKRGYSSVHEFCVKELKYSDGAAFRRIKAMKLVEEIPEVVNALQQGSLNLSTASQLQRVFETKAKEQPMTKKEKMELITSVKKKSCREAERTMAKICPEAIGSPVKARAVNETQVKLELVIEGEFYQKIEKLKALNSLRNKSLIELLEELVDQELNRKDPEVGRRKVSAASAARAASTSSASFPASAASASKVNILELKSNKTNIPESAKMNELEINKMNVLANTKTEALERQIPSKRTRYLSSNIKRQVWLRDMGCCSYTDPLTKRKCESKYKLTFEHIQPYSMGGSNSADNLRLLCANHNALTAFKVFGKTKMYSYRDRL